MSNNLKNIFDKFISLSTDNEAYWQKNNSPQSHKPIKDINMTKMNNDVMKKLSEVKDDLLYCVQDINDILNNATVSEEVDTSNEVNPIDNSSSSRAKVTRIKSVKVDNDIISTWNSRRSIDRVIKHLISLGYLSNNTNKLLKQLINVNSSLKFQSNSVGVGFSEIADTGIYVQGASTELIKDFIEKLCKYGDINCEVVVK